MRAYRSSPEGLAAFLRWAGATPWATFGQALEEATDKGWLIPEEIDVDEVQHLRAVVALNREEAAGAHKRIVALEAALRALEAVDPTAEVQARALLDPPKEMQTLSLDFNRLDAQGRVQIGPEAWKRQRLVLLRLYVDDRVLVVDDEGAQCEGILEQTNTVEHVEGGGARFRCVVRLDRTTWQDGSGG